MDQYEFNAPRFVDFTAPEKDDCEDDYFGTIQTTIPSTETKELNVPSDTTGMECIGESTPPKVAADVDDELVHTMEVLHVSEKTPAKQSSSRRIVPSSSGRKSHAMITRLDAITGRIVEVMQTLDFAQDEVSSSASGEVAHSGADVKAGFNQDCGEAPTVAPFYSKLSGAVSDPNLCQKRKRDDVREDTRNCNTQKYISLAEAVLKFQVKTPKRFHTKMQGCSSVPRNNLRPKEPTIPHPPRLTACTRVRQVHYPSRQEREAMEVAEMNRHKIAAQPVDPHIFQSPKLGRRVPKYTEPEPFKLTEVKKKEPEALPSYKFTAQPVPKNLLAPRLPPACSPRPTAHTRRRMENPRAFAETIQEQNGEEVVVQKEVFNFGVPLEVRKNTPMKRSTDVKPFSFEERDREMMRRKEEKIKMILEEEKQARVFHALPLPGFHRRRMGSNQDLSIMSTNSSSQFESDENKNPAVFKAQPALVLKKEPFIPRKLDREPLKPKNLMLKTEQRSKERREFDEKVRAEMEQLEGLRKEYEEMKRREAEEEAAQQRKLAESFRAQPVPKFKTPKKKPQDKKLTSPLTPFSHRSTDDSNTN